MHSWVDGQPADNVPLKDRGLAYGDGVFETIAVKAGQPLLCSTVTCNAWKRVAGVWHWWWITG